MVGEVALAAPKDLSRRLVLCCSSVRVGLSCRIMSHSYGDGHVECVVEAPITAAIEAVSEVFPDDAEIGWTPAGREFLGADTSTCIIRQ